MHRNVILIAVLGLLFTTGTAHAEFNPCPGWLADESAPPPASDNELELSLYTHHWHYSEQHKPVYLIGYDHYLPGGMQCGISAFTNSYGQPSAYVYIGKLWENFWPALPKLTFSLTGGLLYGYVGIHQNSVPLNFHGFSPGAVPDLGYRITDKIGLHIYALYINAVMIGYSQRF